MFSINNFIENISNFVDYIYSKNKYVITYGDNGTPGTSYKIYIDEQFNKIQQKEIPGSSLIGWQELVHQAENMFIKKESIILSDINKQELQNVLQVIENKESDSENGGGYKITYPNGVEKTCNNKKTEEYWKLTYLFFYKYYEKEIPQDEINNNINTVNTKKNILSSIIPMTP